MRRCFRRWISMRRRCAVGGKTYRQVLHSVGGYWLMMAGPVSIERTLYRVAGKAEC